MRKTTRFTQLWSLALAAVLALAASIAVQPARASDLTPGGKNLWRAAVQLGPVGTVKNKKGKTETRFFGWGSGTLISPQGYILTNHHVTDISDIQEEAAKAKVTLLEGKLVVLLTKTPDQPPVATYIAEVVADSADYDLALLRIATDLTGQAVDPAELDLPYLDVGDSDAIELEDTLRIYGYPGIGGSTITFTKGNVSGFDSEQGIDGRAWIKTDATIAGGNSGGTAVNDKGELVGIPTQAKVESAQSATDCRRIQDTNGDGTIDESDSCIPIGGFINALRPVNLSRGLIEEAGAGNTDNGNNDNTTVAEGVQIAGTIVDADTGRAISGAVFIVLKEGVTWDSYTGADEEIYEAVTTDRKGNFEMTQYLERGKTYSLGWGAKGYQPVKQDGLEVTTDTPDVIQAKLKLQKQ